MAVVSGETHAAVCLFQCFCNAVRSTFQTSWEVDSHIAETFRQITLYPSLVEKILTFGWLVFQNENEWVLKM